MKVLFAVHDEKVSLSIVKKYQREYKEIISYKNVYYFNAILKELQRDKTYDRIVIDEEVEEYTSTSYEEKDKFIFNMLDRITDEASNTKGNDIPIILICTDRRTKSEDIFVKLFGIGIYNAIIGNDRSTDEVCRLIYQPRAKKDAKIYYKIDSKDVEYGPETENDVSEEELQHILSYFKKLGKNEDKYVECFRRILSQYSDEQMKVIIAVLPLNVKSILEEKSPEYQRLVAINGGRINRQIKSQVKTSPTSERLIKSTEKKKEEPIVIPSTLDKNLIKKVSIKKPTISIKPPKIQEDDDFEENDDIMDDFEDVVEEIKQEPKRRGRPSKKTFEDNALDQSMEGPKKKRRGRPPKKVIEEEFENEEDIDILPGFDEDEEENNGFKAIDDSLLRPTYEKDEDNSQLPGIDDDEDFDDLYNNENEEDEKEDNNYEEDLLPGLDDEEENEEEIEEDDFKAFEINNNENEDEDREFGDEDDGEDIASLLSNSRKEINQNKVEQSTRTEIDNYGQDYYDDYDYTNYNNLLSSDRKVIAFVGTSKNGTSFIVNNVAKVLADSGIDTAILDATQNKNSYYIYNNNDDKLRMAAANSIENLINGVPGGMQVNKNLSVYVEVPGQSDTNMNNVGKILENLITNHSAVLIDCDFNTPLEYFANAQEIFLVQSMDVLTIQPFTAFLKELKNKDILEQNKIRIIINKAMRLKGVTSRQIVGGMANYNNPEMSIMTELFDRNVIVPIEIPFDVDVYARYLEGLVECDISINKYPKEFQTILKKLVSVIYPLLPAKNSKGKAPKGYQYSNGYSNGFSNSVNNTLNNMKKNY